MKYEINSDPDRSIFLILLTGKFDICDLEECYQTFLDHPDWQPGTDILWDTRQCFSDHLTAVDIQLVGKMTNKYKEKRGPGLAAWVVDREVDFGLGRMFEMINEGKIIYNFKVFRKYSEAEEWIASRRAYKKQS